MHNLKFQFGPCILQIFFTFNFQEPLKSADEVIKEKRKSASDTNKQVKKLQSNIEATTLGDISALADLQAKLKDEEDSVEAKPKAKKAAAKKTTKKSTKKEEASSDESAATDDAAAESR